MTARALSPWALIRHVFSFGSPCVFVGLLSLAGEIAPLTFNFDSFILYSFSPWLLAWMVPSVADVPIALKALCIRLVWTWAVERFLDTGATF